MATNSPRRMAESLFWRAKRSLFTGAGKDPKVVKKIEADGSQIMNSTPDQFRQLIVTETAGWKKVIQEMGIKPDN